jgi:pantetheine-phosphate adenylyltransferase
VNNTAIYPGTFDPITNGHIDILKKATDIFDNVILAVAEDSGKGNLFTVEERKQLCIEATKDISYVRVDSFKGLIVNYARNLGATTMIRGLRAVSDFEYELQLALMNKKMDSDINTIFLVPDYKFLYLSSSLIKQIIRLGGDLKEFIPENVEQALVKKFQEKKSK